MNVRFIKKISIIILVIIVGSMFFFYKKSDQCVVTLDTKKIISYMLSQNTDNLEVKSIDDISACLTDVIENYAKKNQIIILPSQAAIAGGKDITHIIGEKMQRQCLNG